MSSSTTNVLPQLQALLDEAPAGANPYAWWAEVLYKDAYPGIAPWSKPIFLIIAVLSIINLPVTIFTLVNKYRTEKGISLYKMREHSSGGRYICLNATNVFLLGHIVNCVVFTAFPLLHIYNYDAPGQAWKDLTWAAFMWLAPYLSLLFTSVGVLYAILVAPSPMVFASRANSNGELIPHQPPLASLPTWLLNGFIFMAPGAVAIAVLIPGIRLIQACKAMELFGIELFQTIELFATEYAEGITPAIADQAAFLQGLAKAQALKQLSVDRWSPLFGVWLVFVAVASALAIVAFFVVSRVTKTRLHLAQQQATELSAHDSGNYELNDVRNWEKKQTRSPRQQMAVNQARKEHHGFLVQFGAAAILLVICDAMLFVDTVVGYEVHAKRDLLALCLIVPPAAYLIQSTITVGLILSRAWQSKKLPAEPSSANSSPRTFRTGTGHARSDSGFSTNDKKWSSANSTPVKTSGTGAIYVTSLPKHAFPVSPSVVHQIVIDQTVVTEADTASIAGLDAVPRLHRSESKLLQEDEAITPPLTPKSSYGSAF